MYRAVLQALNQTKAINRMKVLLNQTKTIVQTKALKFIRREDYIETKAVN
jgi:hypothetical protein